MIYIFFNFRSGFSDVTETIIALSKDVFSTKKSWFRNYMYESWDCKYYWGISPVVWCSSVDW